MSALLPILRRVEGDRLHWHCPGCNDPHGIKVGPGGWTWNGNAELPTFTPSVLVTGTEWLTDDEHARLMRGEHVEPTPKVCHSFVTDGRMQFLSDCTHALAGQTVAIPNWPTTPSNPEGKP